MKIFFLAVLAALPLLLTSCCTDLFGAGLGEHDRWYADGHVKSTYYGRHFYYDPCSVHDAHARMRGPNSSPYRTYGPECKEGEWHGALFQRHYDPNSIHDAYARPRYGYRYVGNPYR
jgi:hypothetical protein